LLAQKRLLKLNPLVEITPLFDKVTEDNVLSVVNGTQVVLDGTDNLATRLIVNSACVQQRIPCIYGGVSRLRGMITTIIPDKRPALPVFALKALPDSVFSAQPPH